MYTQGLTTGVRVLILYLFSYLTVTLFFPRNFFCLIRINPLSEILAEKRQK